VLNVALNCFIDHSFIKSNYCLNLSINNKSNKSKISKIVYKQKQSTCLLKNTKISSVTTCKYSSSNNNLSSLQSYQRFYGTWWCTVGFLCRGTPALRLLLSYFGKLSSICAKRVRIWMICSTWLKGRVQCFSMQVLMRNSFLLNPEKNWCRSVLLFLKKKQKNCSIPTHCYSQIITSPGLRLGCANNQLNF